MTSGAYTDGLFEVPGSRLRELREAEAERDRYRDALERIAAGDVPGVTFATDDLISLFAQGALTEGGPACPECPLCGRPASSRCMEADCPYDEMGG